MASSYRMGSLRRRRSSAACFRNRVLTAKGEMRLDDVVGPGFALLVRSSRAASIVPKLQQKPWSDLKPRIVVFGEEAVEGAIAVREVSINPRLAQYSDHVLLLRPDRYVAACIASADLDEGAEKVGELVAGTFAAIARRGTRSNSSDAGLTCAVRGLPPSRRTTPECATPQPVSCPAPHSRAASPAGP